MDVRLPTGVGAPYHSYSQKARVVTEAWAEENLYCLACKSPSLSRTANNTEAVDFLCPGCQAGFQLKATRTRVRNRIADAGYEAMKRAIDENRLPHLVILHYSTEMSEVLNLSVIPSFMLSVSAVHARRPLGPLARRAGWIGCDILLDRVPSDGVITIVSDTCVAAPSQVRREFNRCRDLQRLRGESRGWILDLLVGLQRLKQKTFTLTDAYSLETELAMLHPGNRNVRPKIRQQLQRLRDIGYISFLGSGGYSWTK